eukprot:GEMP01002182.1.p1 GENE.GEMP01002182.1~~GEMP01002182.1.p1  ORF type:complete len:995 (+),score=260.70 GEMP01002182.1:203-3187(+)
MAGKRRWYVLLGTVTAVDTLAAVYLFHEIDAEWGYLWFSRIVALALGLVVALKYGTVGKPIMGSEPTASSDVSIEESTTSILSTGESTTLLSLEGSMTSAVPCPAPQPHLPKHQIAVPRAAPSAPPAKLPHNANDDFAGGLSLRLDGRAQRHRGGGACSSADDASSDRREKQMHNVHDANNNDLDVPLVERDYLLPNHWDSNERGTKTATAKVKLRNAAPHPVAAGGETNARELGATVSLMEIDAHRELVSKAKEVSWKANAVLCVLFIFVTTCSFLQGLTTVRTTNASTFSIVCMIACVVLTNVEFVGVKALVDKAKRPLDGEYLPAVHEHELFYEPKMPIAWCKICRERIGPKTGGPEGFKCEDCGDRGFQVCLLCFRKQKAREGSPEEGILRGDKGPKPAPDLTAWQYCRRAAHLCYPFRSAALTALLCVVITQLIRVLMPNFQGSIIDDVIVRDTASFRRNLMWLLGLSVAVSFFGSIQGLSVEIVARRVALDMRTHTFESLLKQDVAFFDGAMTGQLASRMTTDVAAVVQPVRQLMNTVLTNLLLFVGGSAMCLITSWRLTLLASVMIGPLVYITGVYARWSRSLNMKIRVNLADANAVAVEALRNIRTVRAFTAHIGELRIFRSHMTEAWKYGKKDAVASAGVSAATRYLDFAATMLVLWYGGNEVLKEDGDMRIGDLIKFQLYWNMLNEAIKALNGMLNTLIRAASAAQRVFEIIDLEPDICKDAEFELAPRDPAAPGLDIVIENVEFRYHMRPDKVVLRSISVWCPANSTTAIVGKSGSGKSTIISLLLRFYDPTGGRIIIGGQPLQELNLHSYTSQIGVVTQDTQVFCRTVMENVSYGLEDVPLEEVQKACRMANAHDFIEQLSDGYHSMIGEGGVRLSGGQRQRLAIARALVRQPRLLLLDEATSALDAQNEHEVQMAIENLLRGNTHQATLILIAHRLSTVMFCDNICVLHEGNMVEQGSHKELVARKDGAYHRLVQHQLNSK